MAPWLHGTLYVHIHEAKNVPIDRIIRMPDKVAKLEMFFCCCAMRHKQEEDSITFVQMERHVFLMVSPSVTGVCRPSTV